MADFNAPLFDNLREDILRDYRANVENPDTSIGSMTYAEASAVASLIWGLYKNTSWLKKNLVPDNPSSEILLRWAAIFGISTTGKTNTEILAELTERFRNPAAGGNKADVERWAKEVSSTGILDLPLERDIPATLTNSGLSNFNAESFSDNNVENTAFSTGGAAANSNFVLDYGTGESGELVSFGMWKYNEEDVFFKVEYSADGASYSEAVASVTLSGLGWSFGNWASFGSFQFWRFTLLATTTADINIGEVEFYLTGSEKASSTPSYPNYKAAGTFNMVASVAGKRISAKLIEAIYDYLDFKLPIAPKEFWVDRPTELKLTVDVDAFGPADLAAIETDIRAYIRGLGPSKPFIVAQVYVIAINNGATNAVINLPTNDIYPDLFEEIVEESITVNQAV